jgi:hypothetical protein
MNRSARPSRRCLGLALAAGISAVAGCQTSTVQLVSYKDPYFPEKVHVSLSGGAYWTDASGDIHAAGRGTHESKDGTTTHYLCVHMFWNPKPGKTHAEQSMTDATLRYCVATDHGVVVYTGTGFVFPKKALGGGLEITIESAQLRLESRSGDLPDLFGNTRLNGTLLARSDPEAAANLIRDAELLETH